MNLLGVLEGILFVVGDEGVTLKQVCDILNIEMEEAKDALEVAEEDEEVFDEVEEVVATTEE